MPLKSKKQWKKFFAMEAKGELPRGEASKWAHETKTPYRNLPERAGSKKKRHKGRGY